MKTVMAFLLLVATARAEVHLFRVKVQGGQNYGSAVSVGKLESGEYLFLTAAHGFRGADQSTAEVQISRDWHSFHLDKAELSHSNGVDIAIGRVKTQKRIRCTEIARQATYTGHRVGLFGFVGGALRELTGRVSSKGVGWYVYTSGPRTIQGMSGGCVLNANNRLVGIISGYGSDGNRMNSVRYVNRYYRQTCGPFG